MQKTREIILGPPGTGKTTTLIGIVESEIQNGTSPQKIAYVSFTRKAAEEAMSRACEKFGLVPKMFPHFRTLHSLAFRALSVSNSDILEGKKIKEFGDWIGTELSQFRRMDDTTMFGFTPGDRALFMDNLSRIMCIPLRKLYDQNDDGLEWKFVDHMSRGLSAYKTSKGLVDFTDMLTIFTETAVPPDIDVLLVDEAQDLSLLQWKVVDVLANVARRVVIAGDDDQAIYRWAGAAVEYFVDMPGDVVVLDQSWRVPRKIQAIGDSIIRKVSHRREKLWHPREVDGEVFLRNSFSEIDFTGPSTLVLARNNYILREAEQYLRQEGLLYEINGRSSVPKATLDAIRLWERLRKGDTVPASDVLTVYGFMRSGVSVARGYKKLPGIPPEQPVTLEWLKRNGGLLTDDIWHKAMTMIEPMDSAYLLHALRKGQKLSDDTTIRLSTIHGSKGGQADHVVLLTDMASRTYKEYEENPEDEARVWYVAVTRAKNTLSIMNPNTNSHYRI